MTEKSCDLLVIGGGPAGSTLATLVKRHDPSRRIVLVEKARFPRHHIGESLLPGLVPVLKEMGAFEKIDSAGFPKKVGANYVWGKDRQVWENDFNEVNIDEMIARFGALPDRIEYAYQVVRSRYDQILLDHARECGVEVLEETRACSIIEEAGRICGAVLAGPDGVERPFRSDVLADCSGQNGFLSRWRPIRKYDERLKNVAVYSYFKGAKWKYTYNGHPDKTKIFVCSVDCGWFWYIPVSADTVSVGLVTTVDFLKRSGLEPRALYEDRLARCSEIAPLLAGAVRIDGYDGTEGDLLTHSDWSYLNVSASGPGWLAAGDAAVFVDPILSTGVTLAHTGAHRAAYTLLTHWKETDASMRSLLWTDYDRYCRESAAQYLALALFWYGNERDAGLWWKRAAEIQRAWLPLSVKDKAAFVTVTAGLTRHYDRLFSAESVADPGLNRPSDYPFYVSVLGSDPDFDRLAEPMPDSAVPRLLHPWEEEVAFTAEVGKGRLRAGKRVRFLKHLDGDPAADALNPRAMVTPHHLRLLLCIDGRRTAAEVLAEAARAGVPAWWAGAPARRFLADLALQGALAWDAVRAEAV